MSQFKRRYLAWFGPKKKIYDMINPTLLYVNEIWMDYKWQNIAITRIKQITLLFASSCNSALRSYLDDLNHNKPKNHCFQLVSNPKNPFYIVIVLRNPPRKTLVCIKKSQKMVSNLSSILTKITSSMFLFTGKSKQKIFKTFWTCGVLICGGFFTEMWQ